MNQSQGLNLREYTATGINKDDETYKAVMSDEEGNGAGAIELDKALEFANYYTKTDDVRRHKGKTLDMIITLFTGLRRRLFEKDEIYLQRFLAITERKNDEVWGTSWNIQHVFEAYFNDAIKAYVSENTHNVNLLKKGDFEEDDEVENHEVDPWVLSDGATYKGEARFSGKRGLYFNGQPGSCKQVVEELPEGVYTLHFFLLGKCGVRIRNSDGLYWDGRAEQNKYVIKFVEDEVINYFESDIWGDAYCFIVLKKTDDLTIELLPMEGEIGNIDHVRLFKKPLNSSYTVTIQYDGYKVTHKSLHLGKGYRQDDPIDGIDYSKESYFDHAYIIGRYGAHRGEVFNNLLEIIRPKGIQAFLEFVEKAYIEGDS